MGELKGQLSKPSDFHARNSFACTLTESKATRKKEEVGKNNI
jgi:hypothetical protein